MRNLMISVFSLTTLLSNLQAEKVVWSGDVNTNGQPTPFIDLMLHKKYQIKATGVANLGKWHQQGKALASDSCYDFAEGLPPTKYDILRNSLDVSICDETNTYHADHKYASRVFEAKSNRIHFWVADADYSDNTGTLHVELLEISE